MTRYALCLALLMAASAAHARTVQKEPPMGGMKEGEVLLIDDGTCPKGQIKRVVGGNHKTVGGSKDMQRSRSCVKR